MRRILYMSHYYSYPTWDFYLAGHERSVQWIREIDFIDEDS